MVTEEQINKLKQLDRIEYRQKSALIARGGNASLLLGLTIACFIYLSALFMIIYSVGSGQAGIEEVLNATKLTYFFAVTIFLYFSLLQGIRQAEIIRKLSKLNEEYFKTEPKK